MHVDDDDVERRFGRGPALAGYSHRLVHTEAPGRSFLFKNQGRFMRDAPVGEKRRWSDAFYFWVGAAAWRVFVAATRLAAARYPVCGVEGRRGGEKRRLQLCQMLLGDDDIVIVRRWRSDGIGLKLGCRWVGCGWSLLRVSSAGFRYHYGAGWTR